MKKRIPIAELASINIQTADRDKLVDVSGFVFDASIPLEKRIPQVIAIVKNPYCYRYGDMGVQVEFTEDGPALQDLLVDLMLRQKSGL